MCNMTLVVAIALRLADWEGLKARKIIAQGKANLRATPWVNRPQDFQALKGRKSLGYFGNSLPARRNTALRINSGLRFRLPKFAHASIHVSIFSLSPKAQYAIARC